MLCLETLVCISATLHCFWPYVRKKYPKSVLPTSTNNSQPKSFYRLITFYFDNFPVESLKFLFNVDRG